MKGLYFGIAASVLFTAWAMLTSSPLGLGDKPIMDLGNFNYTHHSYMLGVYSHIVLFGVAYLASYFFPSQEPPKNLTIHGWLEKRRNR